MTNRTNAKKLLKSNNRNLFHIFQPKSTQRIYFLKMFTFMTLILLVFTFTGCPSPSPDPSPETTPELSATPTGDSTPEPTEGPTSEPTEQPTEGPTSEPTEQPTEGPTSEPTNEPTPDPTTEPTTEPTPTPVPTETPVPVPITVDADDTDWGSFTPGAIGSGEITNITGYTDGITLYVLVRGTSLNKWQYSLYIDVDNNPSTGFTPALWTNIGAEYLIQNTGSINVFTGTDGTDEWLWEADLSFSIESIDDVNGDDSYNGTIIEIGIPAANIGNTGSNIAIGFVRSVAWVDTDYAPIEGSTALVIGGN